MKRFHRLFCILSDAALITCAMLASVCAIPSAFSVPFRIETLIWMCALAAFLLSGWMHLPRFGVLFGAAFLIGTVAYGVFMRSAITDGAHQLWYSVLKPLSTDFSFLPVPEPIAEIANPVAAVTSLLAVAAAVFGLFIAFALIRGKLTVLTALLPVPPFLLSLIYTNQPPALWTAILLLLYLGGAMAGHGLRKSEAKQRGVFTMLLLPLLVGLALLLPVFSPEETYTPIPFEQRQQMLGRTVGELRDTVLSWFNQNPRDADLRDEGNRKEEDKTIFSINVTESGSYLFRTHSYGQYENGVWTAAAEYNGAFKSMSALGNGQNGQRIVVSIRDAFSSERIVPYGFTEDPEVEVGETFVRAQGRTAYSWLALKSPDPYAAHSVDDAERAYIEFATEQYTMPDGEQKEALRAILSEAGIKKSANAYETALSVAAFVRGSGEYTLTPGKTPEGRDFVRYFLEESHRGYCVHFASATTALLQALNIPARYTVGYSVSVPLADVWSDVPEDASHAWAEVYVKGVGWVPVESTAGYGNVLSGWHGDPSPYEPAVTQRPMVTLTPTPTETPEQTAPATPSLPEKANETPDIGAPTERAGKPLDTETVVEEDRPKKISAWWLLLLLIPILTGGWLIFGAAVRNRRKHLFLQKNAKKGILKMAEYRKRLERYGVAPDPEVDEWAEEAAFSNHAMTAERKELYRRIVNLQNTLYRDAPLKRFAVRWILAVI